VDLIEGKGAMLHMKVAVNEARHQGAAISLDQSGCWTVPLLDPIAISDIDNVLPLDCNCLCARLMVI
jgi:hypothetical protein